MLTTSEIVYNPIDLGSNGVVIPKFHSNNIESKSSNRLVLFWLNTQILVFASCFYFYFYFFYSLSNFSWFALSNGPGTVYVLSSAQAKCVCLILLSPFSLGTPWMYSMNRLFNRPLIFFLQYSLLCVCVHVVALHFIEST